MLRSTSTSITATQEMESKFKEAVEEAEANGLLKEAAEYLQRAHPTFVNLIIQSSAVTEIPKNTIKKKRKKKRALPTGPRCHSDLSHELLLLVMDFIQDGDDFINFITAIQSYPTAGNLSKILALKASLGLESCDCWPLLKIGSVMDEPKAALISEVSHFFNMIEFPKEWSLDMVRLAVSSRKPGLKYTIDPESLNDESVTLLKSLKLVDLSIIGHYSYVPPELIALSTLKVLSLRYCVFDNYVREEGEPVNDDDYRYSIIHFATSLQNSNIEDLDLEGDIGSESFDILSKALPETKVKRLRISFGNDEGYMEVVGQGWGDISVFAANLPAMIKLESLEFQNYEGMDNYETLRRSMSILADGLINSNVSKLVFGKNEYLGGYDLEQVHYGVFEELFDKLDEMESMKSLTLMEPIRAGGASDLLEAFPLGLDVEVHVILSHKANPRPFMVNGLSESLVGSFDLSTFAPKFMAAKDSPDESRLISCILHGGYIDGDVEYGSEY